MTLLSAPLLAGQEDIWINPKFQPVESNRSRLTTPIARLSDHTLATVVNNGLILSDDGMQTWSEPRQISDEVPVNTISRGVPRGGGSSLLHLGDGRLIILWRDRREPGPLNEYWDRATGNPVPHARRDLWMVRSDDSGQSWSTPKKLFDRPGYFYKHIIETTDGTIVAPIQYHARDPGRNVIRVFSSRDGGRTWHQSDDLDIGGRGNHDGLLEPTLVQLNNGRVWMLMRTNLDEFYESFSNDEGETWSDPKPSGIPASSSPGYLLRLSSGRIVLVWNRLHPERDEDFPRRDGRNYLTDKPASWHRQELSIALSDDDGRSWGDPVVVARHRKPKGRLAYPYVFEKEPGELWIFTSKGDLELSVGERDLLTNLPRE